MQTKKQSLIEVITNIAIGYFIALLSQIVIFPFFGINISIQDNLLIGFWFTLIAIIRGYVVRRAFNKLWGKK